MNIERTVRDTHAWLSGRPDGWEIVAVNDGSTDDTGAKLAALARAVPGLRVVTHEQNLGYGAAVRSGCDAARGSVIGFMDSDGQFEARDFSLLLPALSRAPFVVGRRLIRADPWRRTLNAAMFSVLCRVVLGIRVRDVNCAMKVFTRETWLRVRPAHSTGALVNAEMFHRAQRAGIPWLVVDVPHAPRRFGTPTGAQLKVIGRMFRELWLVKTAHGDSAR